MPTYSISETKARLSQILRDLTRGEETIITRRGQPCGRITAVDASADDRPSLATLRGALADFPTLTSRTAGPRPWQEHGGHDDQ